MKRLFLILAALTLPVQAYAQFPSQNVTLPAFVMPASAVNGGGVVTSPQLLGPDGTTSLPTYSFASDTDTGVYVYPGNQGVGLFASQGATNSGWYGTGLVLSSSGLLSWTTAGIGSSSIDLSVTREGADHLFQRRSTNAQRASWANTYTSATNYESFSVDWQTTANVGIAGCRTAATGTGRSCRFASQANNAGTISYLEIGATGSTTLTGAFVSYNGVAVAGQGLEAIRAQATTGSVVNTGTASIATWTPGAADVEVEVGCRVNITVSTNHTFSCDVTYTDVSNTARTRVLEMFPITGTPLTSGLMTNAIGAGDFASAVTRIGVKASTAIVVRTSSGGTFTTVTYTASGTIKQIG